ncbi:DMT family transporter [Bacillus cereus]|uniref:DMT family transporter n=1 Tax=Bacillus cereus TaxID=1396 RepID=UPI001E59E06A|nr:SMR family transporter [Bacillus cereus]MCD2338318.1 SMR family transporter [Bacillus cereus]
MKVYLLLIIAIGFEVTGTLFMGISGGFNKLQPTIMVFSCYLVALFLSVIILKKMEVGYFNAIWSGLGTVLVVLLGILFFNESINSLKFFGITCIIIGILLLNLKAKHKETEVI